MYDTVDKEERHELWAVLLDVSSSAWAVGRKGKEHAMEMSDVHMVQRLESGELVATYSNVRGLITY